MHLTNDCFVLTPEKAIELVDENTIGRPSTSCLQLATRFITSQPSDMMRVGSLTSILVWLAQSEHLTHAQEQASQSGACLSTILSA